MQQTYEHLQAQFSGGVHVVDVADEDATWAVSRLREKSSE